MNLSGWFENHKRMRSGCSRVEGAGYWNSLTASTGDIASTIDGRSGVGVAAGVGATVGDARVGVAVAGRGVGVGVDSRVPSLNYTDMLASPPE